MGVGSHWQGIALSSGILTFWLLKLQKLEIELPLASEIFTACVSTYAHVGILRLGKSSHWEEKAIYSALSREIILILTTETKNRGWTTSHCQKNLQNSGDPSPRKFSACALDFVWFACLTFFSTRMSIDQWNNSTARAGGWHSQGILRYRNCIHKSDSVMPPAECTVVSKHSWNPIDVAWH